MSKIFIVGIVASGKTTLAKEMSLRMDIPWYELDSVVHKHTINGRIKQSFQEQQSEINSIDATGNWIFEGVYRDSYHCLLDLADTIIFLDTPLWKKNIVLSSDSLNNSLKLSNVTMNQTFIC
ncbi:MAG: hypothetical protein AB9835_10245 [Eubacteriales bacterium]